jgi:hypothetical protein
MLADIPFYGGQGFLAIGAELPSVAIYAQLDMFFGRTEAGLFTAHIRPAFVAHGIIGRVRMGGGLQAGALVIRRATSSQNLTGATLGLVADILVDLVQWETSGLYLGASPFFDVTLSSQSGILWGGTVQLGYRL